MASTGDLGERPREPLKIAPGFAEEAKRHQSSPHYNFGSVAERFMALVLPARGGSAFGGKTTYGYNIHFI
ncbi:MAG: hypothetical protein HYW89_01520 [Candidatus Sungiibacteriota bacterium]|uniref:Uncharacterized protein n=1 Tax=Candidatus Sungiibacteriota bacterium TaxID=2750080 RepID=A0A7T5UQW1_9BACT|nr:MAG: hypothetical protein HYW89_01520 [Candidatus Sungbacteria bacterium]